MKRLAALLLLAACDHPPPEPRFVDAAVLDRPGGLGANTVHDPRPACQWDDRELPVDVSRDPFARPMSARPAADMFPNNTG